MKPAFSCRERNPYGIRDTLYICNGGAYSKGRLLVPESCSIQGAIEDVTGKSYTLGTRSNKWETKQTDEWFRRQYAAMPFSELGLWWFALRHRSNYRVRVGVQHGVRWAHLCVEFRYFSDFTTTTGPKRRRQTRADPGVLAYWLMLDDRLRQLDATWDVIDSSVASGEIYFDSFPVTAEGIERVALTSRDRGPGTACILPMSEKKLAVAWVEANNNRPEWQVEARIPVTPIQTDQAALDAIYENFIFALARDFQPGPSHNLDLASRAIRSTVVHVI